MTMPITRKQERLWRFIKSCDRSPSYEEMMKATGVNSKSQISSMVRSLKRRGYVTYTPGAVRSIVAIDPSVGLSSFSTAELAAELAQRLA